MSERRVLVIHFNGKWDGTCYVGGKARGKLVHGESFYLSTVTSLVDTILKDGHTTAANDYQIDELVNVNGESVVVNINSDNDVESLFRTNHSPVIYVSHRSTPTGRIDPHNDDVVGSSSSFTQQEGFVQMMDRYNAMKGKYAYNNPANNIGELNIEDEVVADDMNMDSDDSSDDSLDYETFENPSDIHPENGPQCALPWSIPCMPSTLPQSSVDVPHVNGTPGILNEADTFISKEDMCKSVGYYHLYNAVEYRVKKSDPDRWHLKCKHGDCNFVYRAIGKQGLWMTMKFISHTCRLNPNRSAPLSLPSKVVGSFYAAKQLEKSTTMTPINILNDLKLNHGMHLQYNQASRSSNRATEMIYGDSDESFSMLPSYLNQLLTANPGSVVRLLTDEQDRFKYCFFALRASIDGFLNFGRPVIVVDGTHLKGKYKGVAFVAVTQDCNHQVYPLATGIGDVENNDSWKWFFEKLREAYGCPNDLLIVSDQQKSIIRAVETVYPDATHGFCYHHIQKNLVVYGQKLIQTFKSAAYTYHESEYNRIIESIDRVHDGKFLDYLSNVKKERWSRVHCHVRRYEFMTSNAAESWNKSILWARNKPVVYVLECVRKKMQDWFHDRLTDAQSIRGELCTQVTSELSKLIRLSDKLVVQPLACDRYKVVNGTISYVVNLVNRSCECCRFQLEGIPCTHALAAIRHANYDVNSFVDDCYRSSHLRRLWGGFVVPIPDPTEWVVPPHVKSLKCGAPPCPRQAGRPKLSRNQSVLESSSSRRKKQRCSRCNQTSHNRVNCRAYIPLGGPSEEEACDVSESSGVNIDGPRRHRCSVCHGQGHTKRTCPRSVN